jgi:hypothetical protein
VPISPNDIVRPFQTPAVSPEQPYLSQYNLATNAPIFVTPGFGAASSGQLPPIQTGSSHAEQSTSFYCVAAQSEVKKG